MCVVVNYFYGVPFCPFYYVIVYVCSVIHCVQRPTGHVPSRTESDRGQKKKLPVPLCLLVYAYAGGRSDG